MKPALLILLSAFLAGCAQTDSSAFIQGSIRIVSPVQQVGLGAVMEDGGTTQYAIKDAAGKSFDVFIDHRLSTKTPGAIYLVAYPGEAHSVRVTNEVEFRKIVRLQ